MRRTPENTVQVGLFNEYFDLIVTELKDKFGLFQYVDKNLRDIYLKFRTNYFLLLSIWLLETTTIDFGR